MSEIRPYPHNPAYGVTRCGEVWRIERSRFGRPVPHRIQPFMGKNGYWYVGGGLSPLGTKTVHRIVAETWVENPHGHAEVAHNDSNRANCHADNLRWDTRAGNFADRVAHGTHNRGERNATAKLTESDVVAIRRSLGTHQFVADVFGISRQHVTYLRSGKGWAHVD